MCGKMMIDFEPEDWKDLIGNPTAIKKIRQWLPKNHVFIHGPAGVGKTSTVKIWAKKSGFDICEINASDERDLESLKRLNRKVRLQPFKPTLFVLDEVDGIQWWKHGDFIFTMLSKSKNPFVLIANDPYQIKKTHETWKKKHKKKTVIKEVRFWKPRVPTVVARLKAIERKHNAKFNFSNVSTDIRASINTLQASSDKYTPEQNVFDILRDLFLHKKTDNIDLKKHTYWINENIPRLYHGYNMIKAFSVLKIAVMCNNPKPLGLLPELQFLGTLEYPMYLRRSTQAYQKLKKGA